MGEKEQNKRLMELAQQALQANEEHLDALKTFTQRLEAELVTMDKLLDAADTIDESDLDVGYSVTVPGSARATAPIAMKDLLSPELPFHKSALKRSQYRNFTEVHQMKPKELEALAEAIQAEGYRMHALEIQRKGFTAFQNITAQTTHIPALDAEGIDWSRIAEKMSAVSMATRTARECEIRWLGEQHPEFNHEPWSKDEVQKVKSLAAEFIDGRRDWVTIAKRLGTRRTPLDCMRHAIPRKVHQWTAEADERLLKAIRMYGHNNWHLVARYVSEDATPSQCSSRFEKTLDDSIKHTAWSPEEDARLSAAVAAYGSSWVDVAANIPGRHNDQCRDRWTEQVNPNINRSQWSEEEDRMLVDYVREHENAPWKDISEHLCNGRTEAMCRSRYTVLQKGKGANADQAMSAVDTEGRVASAGQAIFKSCFPPAHSRSTTPASYDTENRHPNQIVFLEPVVSSDPGSHKYYRLQPTSGFETAAAGDISPSNIPPSKKRKTRTRIAKSKIRPRAEPEPTSPSRDQPDC